MSLTTRANPTPLDLHENRQAHQALNQMFVEMDERVSALSSGKGSITENYVTIGASAILTNERALTAGAGLNLADGGANSTVTLSITNSGVTYAMIQNLTANRLLGRNPSGAGAVEEITIGSGLSLSGTTLGTALTFASLPASLAEGDLIVGNGLGSWANSGVALSGQYLGSNGTINLFKYVTLTETLISAADRIIGTAGTPGLQFASELVCTAAGRALIDDATAADQRTTLGLGTLAVINSPLPIANGGTGQAGQTAAFDALDPLTTKGDIIVHNGTNSIRLAVGTDTHVLTADSTQASGVKWAAVGGVGTHVLLDSAVHTDTATNAVSRGSIIYGNSTPAWTELVVGTGFLKANGTDVTGWSTIAEGDLPSVFLHKTGTQDTVDVVHTWSGSTALAFRNNAETYLASPSIGVLGAYFVTGGGFGFYNDDGVGHVLEATILKDRFLMEAGATDVWIDWGGGSGVLRIGRSTSTVDLEIASTGVFKFNTALASATGLDAATSGELSIGIPWNTKKYTFTASEMKFLTGSANEPNFNIGTVNKLIFKTGTTTEFTLEPDTMTFEMGLTDFAFYYPSGASQFVVRYGATSVFGIGNKLIALDPSGNNIVIDGATASTAKFSIAGTEYMRLGLGTLTLSPALGSPFKLDGATSGMGKFYIGANEEMRLEPGALTMFGPGANDPKFDWATSNRLSIFIGATEALRVTGSTFVYGILEVGAVGNGQRIYFADTYPTGSSTEGSFFWNTASRSFYLHSDSAHTIALARATQTSSLTVDATSTTRTQISSGTTISANHMKAGKSFHVRAWGHASSDASPPALTITVELGTTVICSTGAVAVPASMTNQGWVVECDITVRTTGAAGTVFGQGFMQFNSAAPAIRQMVNTATDTVDTTASKDLAVYATWASDTATNTITGTNSSVIEVGS